MTLNRNCPESSAEIMKEEFWCRCKNETAQFSKPTPFEHLPHCLWYRELTRSLPTYRENVLLEKSTRRKFCRPVASSASYRKKRKMTEAVIDENEKKRIFVVYNLHSFVLERLGKDIDFSKVLFSAATVLCCRKWAGELHQRRLKILSWAKKTLQNFALFYTLRYWLGKWDWTN